MKLPPVVKRLLDDERLRLAHFSVSAVVFFVSCAMLYFVEKQMPPSLDQEISALAFLLLAGLSFFWAMSMQLLHIFSKLHKK